MIEIWFTLTESEYLEAQDIFMRARRRKSRAWRWTLIIVFLLGVSIMLLNAPKPLSVVTLPVYAPAILAIATMPFWWRFALKSTFKKRFQKEQANLTNAHLKLDASGYFCEVPGVGTGVAEWGGISVWSEGSSVFVLRSGYLMRIIPKSQLSSLQLEDLRALLAEKIGPAGIERL